MNPEDFYVAKKIEEEITELRNEKEHLNKLDVVTELSLSRGLGQYYKLKSKCIDFNLIKTILLSMIEQKIKELEKEFESL